MKTLAKAEHTSWRAMLDALKSAGYVTQDDLSARTSDRSSPQRCWIADSVVALPDSHDLRNRFRQLFPGEIVLARFEQWIAVAELLREERQRPGA